MSVVVVIPAYNSGRQLRDVVERLQKLALPALTRIVIVDDGSTDDTADETRSLCSRSELVRGIYRSSNGGYGAALKDGLAQAALEGALQVACVHADGQYSPEALPGLLQEATRRGLDVLQGSRIVGGTALQGGMPLYKYAANALLNRLENWTLELEMTDYHSGYLIYSKQALEALPLQALSNSFDFDLEVIAAARARGLTVGEAPIPTHYGDEVSHLNPLTYGLRVLHVLWKYRRGHYARA